MKKGALFYNRFMKGAAKLPASLFRSLLSASVRCASNTEAYRNIGEAGSRVPARPGRAIENFGSMGYNAIAEKSLLAGDTMAAAACYRNEECRGK